jgi:hypothetical protein
MRHGKKWTIKKMLSCAVNGFAEMELCRESSRSKCMGQIVK